MSGPRPGSATLNEPVVPIALYLGMICFREAREY